MSCRSLFSLLSLAILAILPITARPLAAEEAAPLKIGLIGDSTVCDYPARSSKRGWGQMMGEFLVPGTKIFNYARGGLSSKSFPAESWRELLSKKPDIVFIQFGHNDMKRRDPGRFTDPEVEYRQNLRRYAEEARAAGAAPIFVTPVSRRVYKQGRLTRELQPYADAMKAEGEALGVPVVDLYALSGALFVRLGEEQSGGYTINFMDQEDRPGMGDRSHFTAFGAREMAGLVVTEAALLEPRFAASERDPKKAAR